jgi:hypothetical protein
MITLQCIRAVRAIDCTSTHFIATLLCCINSSALQEIDLPPLPANARYLFHANECYDWGTFGWAIMAQHVELAKYKSFIFMNSSVRGPYLPAYLKVCHHSYLLISRYVITATCLSKGMSSQLPAYLKVCLHSYLI